MIAHSVLVHSCNHARYIGACIDSLLAQTQPPEEIIVYDAGSRDGTVPILQRYGAKIRLLCGPPTAQPAHITEAGAVQAAFNASRGRLLFLLDGDDRFKPDKIARYADAFDRNPEASVVQAPLERIDAHGGPAGVYFEPRYHISNHLREIHRRQDVNFFYPTSALAFSRYYLERFLPLGLSDRLPLWTDARLCIPAAYYGRIVTLLDPLTEARYHTPTDRARTHSAPQQLRQIFMRAQVFNAFCRRHRLRTISPWRNVRVYLLLLACAIPSGWQASRGQATHGATSS